MRYLYKLVGITFFLFITVLPQEHKSIHEMESDYYNKHPEEIIVENNNHIYKNPPYEITGQLSTTHRVYGFHPYWVSDATASGYHFNLLSHVAYFSAEVDTAVTTTGGFMTTHNWSSTQVVNYCKANALKIHLTITMFARHDRVIANATNRTNLAINILNQIKLRDADGANIDFEAVSSSQAANYRLFINELGTLLKANNLELAICIPAVDWSGIYTSTFFSTNNSVVDYYFLMAYDYYYSGSSTAGPISPLTTGTSIYHVTRSINSYLAAGATAGKLLAGFGYYGFDWTVTANTRMATVKSGTKGTAKTYSQISSTITGIATSDKFFDATYSVPWYRYNNGTDWHQVWYEDEQSILLKYNAVKSLNLIGAGIWALSYDGVYAGMWDALMASFGSISDNIFTTLDNFELSVGHFDKTPTYSGSTVGIDAASSAARSIEDAKNGSGSMKVVLKDNSSVSTDWTVRLLSGGGAVTNNISLGSKGHIGLWLKTSSAPIGAKIAVTLDDAAGGTELSPKLDIANNATWTLYEWDLESTGWSSFAGGNGMINGPVTTLDAVMFYAPNASPDWTIYFDDVLYNPNGALPVQLIAFTCSINGSSVHLRWSTATETNLGYFEIERSRNNSSFLKVGRINSSGSSTSLKQYFFSDDNLAEGKYQYRLKMIDDDGTSKYSPLQAIELSVPKEYYLEQNYPNPFNPITTISYTLPVESRVELLIYNINGEKVAELVNETQEAGSYTVSFNAMRLASGVYLCQLRAGEFLQIKKMVLLK